MKKQLESLAHLATVLTALVAVAALILAIFQITQATRSQREASAQEAYKAYIELAIQNPKLASVTFDATSDEGIRYAWFVTYFLNASEQIYQLSPDDEEWRATIGTQICVHHVYLSAAEYQAELKGHYSKGFRNFVDASLKGCNTSTVPT